MTDKQWFCVNCASQSGNDTSGMTSLGVDGKCEKCGSDAVISIASAVHTLRASATTPTGEALHEATTADFAPATTHKAKRRFDDIDTLVAVTEEAILNARKAGYGIDKQMQSLAPDIWQWWDGFGLTYYFGLENLLETPTVLTMEFENSDGNTKILKLEPHYLRIAESKPQVIDNAHVAQAPIEDKT